MRSGRLRERVTIRTPGAVDDYGHPGQSQDVATVWAEVTPQSASEVETSDATAARPVWTVRLRYRDDVPDNGEIVYRGRVLRILTSHDEDGRRRSLVVTCEELR